jgi:hypothetical protein
VTSLGILVAFGVSVGSYSSRRTRMEDYLRASNQKLVLLRTPTRVVAYHHMAGNLVVQTPKTNRSEIADELSLVFGAPCVVLPTRDVIFCISVAEKANSPSLQAGIRCTKGIAFKVKGRPCTVDLKPTPRAEFFRINEYAVGVFKKDQLRIEGTSDKETRAGGWRAISDDISSVVGGIWTARTLTRIQGVVTKALEQEHRLPHRSNQ